MRCLRICHAYNGVLLLQSQMSNYIITKDFSELKTLGSDWRSNICYDKCFQRKRCWEPASEFYNYERADCPTSQEHEHMDLGPGKYASGLRPIYIYDIVVKFKSKSRPRLTFL